MNTNSNTTLVILFFCIILLSLTTIASADDYYVALTGDNGDPGTIGEPWRTITYAAQEAIAGDTVYIKGGNYGKEFVIVKNSGTSGNYITFQSYDGEAKLISDDKTYGDTNYGIDITGKSYIKLQGFNISWYFYNINTDYSHHLIINDTVCFNGYKGLEIMHGTYALIQNCTMYDNDMHNIELRGNDYSIIENTFCYSNYASGPGFRADYHFALQHTADYNIVRDCTAGILRPEGAVSNHGFVCRDESSHNLFLNCTSVCTNTEHFKTSEDSNYNIFDNCSAIEPWVNDDVHAFFLKSSHNIVRNCVAINQRKGASIYWSDKESEGPISNNTIENCVFTDNYYGLQIWIDSDGSSYPPTDNTFKNNIIYDNNYGVWIQSGVTGTTIEYNNVYDNSPNYYGCSPGTGSISVDPLFADYSNEDFHLKSAYGRWTGTTWTTDSVTSSCIDAGNPNDDYSNELEGNGNRINMGMYGNTPEASLSSGTPPEDPPEDPPIPEAESYDNRLKETTPDYVNNIGTYLDVGFTSETNSKYRIWAWYNLSNYDLTDIVDEATYKLYWWDNSSNRNKSTEVKIFLVNNTTDTNFINWNNRTEDTPWDNPGGDWNDSEGTPQGSVAYATALVPETLPSGWIEFDVTKLVQGIINGTLDNYGFIIIANETDTNRIVFRSQDYTTPAYRPYLNITLEGDPENVIGTGGSLWSGNSTMENTTEDLGDNYIKVGIFADNFDDNDKTGWNTLDGSWTVSNGALHPSNIAEQCIISYTPPITENLRISMDYTETNPDDCGGGVAVAFIENVENFYFSGVVDNSLDADDIKVMERYLDSWQSELFIDVGAIETSGPNDLKIIGTKNSTDYISVEVYYPNNTLISMGGGIDSTSETNSIGIRVTSTITGNQISFDNYRSRIIGQLSGNITTWYDAGSDTTTSVIINATTPTNTNYTVWHCENGTNAFIQVGGIRTGNETIQLSPAYQNTDIRLILNGNMTKTPEILTITFDESSEEDVTPPASISDLVNETGHWWHKWTWNNPLDSDFNYTVIYINEIWAINTSLTEYNLSASVRNTSNISTKTVDVLGNVNTTWLNNTSSIPNSPIILSDISSIYSLSPGQTLSIDANYTDADGDSGIFDDNSDEWNIDANGIVSWVTDENSNNTNYWYINITDNNGSIDIVNFTVYVGFTEFIDPTLPHNSITFNNYIQINQSIRYNDISSFIWIWDETNTNFINDEYVLYMQFNNNSEIGDNATNSVDLSPAQNNGSFINGTYGNWTQDGGLHFDGINDIMTCGNDISFYEEEIEINVIVKFHIIDHLFHSIFYKSNNDISLYLYGPQFFRFQLKNVGTLDYPTSNFNVDQIYDITASYNRSMMVLYIDGIEVANESIQSNIDDGPSPIYFGLSPEGYANVTMYQASASTNVSSPAEVYQKHISSLQKYNATQWYFTSNQTELISETYDFQTIVNYNSSDTRSITVDTLEIDKWELYQFDLNTTNTITNPYTDIWLNASFNHSEGNITVNGFWDGGENWSIRFAPNATGYWEFTTSSNDSQLNGQTGNFTCMASDNPGFVIRDPNNNYSFIRSEGNPIFWMGDTNWNMMSNRSDALTYDIFTKYVDNRSHQKFNFIRGYILSFYVTSTDSAHYNEGGWAFYDWDPDTINPEYFRQADARIEYANSKDITMNLVYGADEELLTDFFGWDNGKMERYIKYCDARFGAYDIAWEGRAEFEEQSTIPYAIPLANAIGNWTEDHDSHNHIQSMHTGNSNNELGNEIWLDWIMHQGQDWDLIKTDRDDYNKPVMNEEFYYENSGAGATNEFMVDAEITRNGAWNVMVHGATGLAWANTGTLNYRSGPFAGLEYSVSPCAAYMTHLYNFWNATEHQYMAPNSTIIVSGTANATVNPNTEYILYLDNGGDIVVDLSGTNGKFNAQWYNPRVGTFDEHYIIEGGDSTTEFSAPSTEDWVLHLTKSIISNTQIFGNNGFPWAGDSTLENVVVRGNGRITLDLNSSDYYSWYDYQTQSTDSVKLVNLNRTNAEDGNITGLYTGLTWNATNGLDFTGIDGNRIDTVNMLPADTTMTIRSFMIDDTKDNCLVSSISDSSTDRQFMIWYDNYDSPDRAAFGASSDGSNFDTVRYGTTETLPSTNYNIGLSYDSSTSKLLVNGIQEGTDGGALYDNSQPLTFGLQGGDTAKLYTGTILDTKIYSRSPMPAWELLEIGDPHNNYYKLTGNITLWHETQTEHVTKSITINATTPTNTNYTIWHSENGTDSFTQIGGIYSNNQSIDVSPWYTYTDIKIILNGNLTATPELIEVTFNTGQMNDSPIISFIPPTEENNTILYQDHTYINTTISDPENDNLTAFLNWNNSLVGWWTMNEGTGNVVEDLSGYGNNGSFTNGSTGNWTTDGKFGNAMTFDGVNDYVNAGIPTVSDNCTISFWEYTYSGDGYFISDSNDITNIFIRRFGNGVIIQMGEADWIFGTIPLSENVWHNHVIIHNSSGVYSWYIDGVYISSQSGSNFNGFTTNVYFGNRVTLDRNFNGSIDEICIYNRALSHDEINASFDAGSYRLFNNFTNLTDGTYNYTAYVQDEIGNINNTETRYITIDTDNDPSIEFIAPTEANNTVIYLDHTLINTTVSDIDDNNMTALLNWNNSLVGWWTMNEGTGNIVEDLSGYSNNGSFTDGTTGNWTTDGMFGDAITFDGIDDYVNCGNDENFNITDAITIETWVKIHKTQYNTIIDKTGSNVERPYQILINNVNKPEFNVYDSVNYPQAISGDAITLDTWTHIVGIRTVGDRLKLYVNGVLKSNVSDTASTANNNNNFVIGKRTYGGTSFSNTTIDEVRIYNHALSHNEINASFDAGSYRLFNNFTDLEDGTYNYTAYVQDEIGNINNTETRYITIDAPTYITGSGWVSLAMPYTTNNLTQIDNNLTDDLIHSAFNGLTQRSISHWSGYDPYGDYEVEQRYGYMVYFSSEQTTAINPPAIIPTITLYPGWNMIGHLSKSDTTITEIMTNIGANATSCHYWNGTAWASDGNTIIPASKALYVYITDITQWSG